MNKSIIIGSLVILGIGAAFALSNSSHTPSGTSGKNVLWVTPQTNSQGGSSPQITTTSQDPQDIVPGLYPNPIQNTATTEGFKIASVMVENNTDAAGTPVSDHLQLTLQNVTKTDLTNFEVYYTITDTVTNKKEGYYKKLTNYVLKAGETQTINFDNGSGDGHFTVNKHSIYYTSSDPLQFSVMVSTPGYKPETASVSKAAGGSEVQGQ